MSHPIRSQGRPGAVAFCKGCRSAGNSLRRGIGKQLLAFLQCQTQSRGTLSPRLPRRAKPGAVSNSCITSRCHAGREHACSLKFRLLSGLSPLATAASRFMRICRESISNVVTIFVKGLDAAFICIPNPISSCRSIAPAQTHTCDHAGTRPVVEHICLRPSS